MLLIGLFVASFCFLGFISISHLELSIERQLIDSLNLFLDSQSFAYSPNTPTRCIIEDEKCDITIGKKGNAKLIDATLTSGVLSFEIQFISNISYSNFKKGGSKK
ncbi:hypothetical protein AT15_08280 [Kosmotoga arenicorallina S304]|uniref:Uncharacterized protein n=1 Tax=Kosmotoga arenicorallina S304 TaxID=1453497 RepID=A0A176K1E6_9BACT|nr:hypothetical protein [Kosmotoga arenicorallina]OAA30967.1 hypothetical protein AT15_08280 [Kosmotoga arenicorallina S304]